MALSRPNSIFGVHSVCAYNPDTLMPYGIAKVVGSFSVNFAGEPIELQGGSSLFPWDIENGPISTEGSLLLREYPDWLYQAFMGNSATTNAAEASGNVGTITDVYGTSVVAATGILSATAKAGATASLKTGVYVVKAASATTVDVYALTDVDNARGTAFTFQNDALKITASPLTIALSTAVEIPGTGVELTGGGSAIAMTTGDTAMFEVRAINTGSTTAVVGTSTPSFVDVGLLVAAQKKGNNEVFLLDIYRAKAIGVPMNFTEKAWMESEITLRAFRDSTRDGVFKSIRVDGT